jgi:hypothetical protein
MKKRSPLRDPTEGDLVRCKEDEEGCAYSRKVLFAENHLVWWQPPGRPPRSQPMALKGWREWAKGGEVLHKAPDPPVIPR